MLQYRETYVNETRGHSFGESGWLDYDGTRGELFRSCKREYGRATNMYIDLKDGKTLPIGWVFSKRMTYEDCDDTYVREVWVEVREVEDHQQDAWRRR